MPLHREHPDEEDEVAHAEDQQGAVAAHRVDGGAERDPRDVVDDPLPAGHEAEQVEGVADDGEQQRGCGEELLQPRDVAAEALDLWGADDDDHQDRDHRAEGPVDAEARTLDGLGGHHGGERPVRDVDERVQRAEHRVRDVGVDVLRRGAAEVRHREQRHRGEQQGRGDDQDVGPEPAPPAPRDVHQAPREQVGERVPDAHDEEHRADRRRR